jgi:uncharacterized ion transporter superfamily protein YfcC
LVPIGIIIARTLGYDALTGAAMVILGAASGFSGGMLNPFTVGVAQTVAELPMFSGWGLRTIIYQGTSNNNTNGNKYNSFFS